MGTKLTPLAFDIETTGFESDATVTVIGLVLPLGCRVFLNTDGYPVEVERIERELGDEFDTTVDLSSHPDEQALLKSVTAFVQGSVSTNDYMLVAYNGDVYRGGFDLPFLRTRCARLDLPWPFDDVPYADLLPIFRNRFNTTVDDGGVSDLEGVYETVIDGSLNELDPFEGSAEAVTAFENGEFESLLAHNVADILRTDALAQLAGRFCSKSEFKLKSLTPTDRDPALTQPDVGDQP